jgi:2C-methyl-D-erythritol 2,4-cyclodiphosphate synthase
VIGTTLAAEYQDKDGQLSIQRLPKLLHNDDGPGKPVSIEAVIGRRPILAFGNSDGDLQMLQWTLAGPGRRFAGLVHHTDANREWAYDRQSSVGRLDKALDIANRQGWTVVDMARDWRRVYPFDKE